MDDQLTREFLAESEELVEGLYADLELLRARREDGRGRRELVGRLFRRAHTLKGTASAAGLDPAAEVAHEFESLLDAVRLGHAGLSDAVLDAFEEAASAVSSCLGAASRGEHVEAPRAPLERLRALAAPQAGAEAKRAPSAAGVALPEELARSLTEFERQRLREAVEEGARVFVVVADFNLTDFDEQFRRLSDALGERGEVVSTLPGVEAGAPDRVRFRVLHATDDEAARLSERVAAFGAAVQECAREPAGEAAHVGEGAAAPAEPAAPMSHPALTVRVSLEELDGLLAAAHELFAETAAALGESERARRVRARSAELEARLTALRMVPVRATLERAARAGRSAARAVG
ncbi:MAG TPA: Hpt domain-containing protein, partial [Pyrinomonadaceae bacterium]|nr:Hpt domain-containing protein [Pyrinomonadaceae bacterium]